MVEPRRIKLKRTMKNLKAQLKRREKNISNMKGLIKDLKRKLERLGENENFPLWYTRLE